MPHTKLAARVARITAAAVSLMWVACAVQAPPAAPVVHPAKRPPPRERPGKPPPLLEDARGIAGAPRDDTAFEYDVEAYEEQTPPLLDGIPAISRAVGGTLQPYLDSRRARLAALSPDGTRMLVLTRLSETTQVHLLEAPMGMRRQLTFGPEPVEQAAFLPAPHDGISYRRDIGGREDYQILSLDRASARVTRLSDGESRHGPFRWSSGGALAYTNNARNGRDMDVYVAEPGAAARRVAELSGQWVVMGWSQDGKRLLMQQFAAVDERTVHVVDVATGAMTALHALRKGVAITGALFANRPDVMYVSANHDRDVVGIFELVLGSQSWRPLTPKLRWDVEEMALAPDGKTLAYTANEDGVSRLYLLELATAKSTPLTIPAGVVSGLRFVRKTRSLAFTLTTATQPADAFTLDLEARRLVRWTHSETGGVPERHFVAPELVRIASFDGTNIPTFVYRPRQPGPRPAIVWIHGGPEEQYRPAFDPIVQYFAAARGIAVIAPNVRGSNGYGKRYLSMDDGTRRHEAIADVGAVLDWIASQPELDAGRVGIHGASYGGYVVLSSLVAFGSRIAAGSSLVGMSNLVSFLENTRDYRRDLRRSEYGDERDPAVREYLSSISPLARASSIESALLVAHGANDPRVPLSEAQQIVRAVRDGGGRAWLFVAESEGHTLRRRRSRDAFYRVLGEFFERQLLGADKREQSSNNE